MGVRGGTYTRGPVCINVEGGKGSLETGGVIHGGDKDDDNSGASKPACAEHIGHVPDEEYEVNGTIPHGAGSGMIAENREVHYGLDDGPEPPGGLANAKNTAVANRLDDLPDRIEGRNGRGENSAVP